MVMKRIGITCTAQPNSQKKYIRPLQADAVSRTADSGGHYVCAEYVPCGRRGMGRSISILAIGTGTAVSDTSKSLEGTAYTSRY